MENKTFKNKSLEELESIIINCLAIAGITINIIGVFIATLVPSNHYNIFPTATHLAFQIIIFIFRKKLRYSITCFFLTVGCANFLFPAILFTERMGLSGSFVFYLFIAPIAYGISINKKKWIWAPIATLIEYLFIFVYINNKTASIAAENIYLYSASFSISYLFIFFITFFFTNILFEHSKKLMKITYHDELTSLYNRRKLDEDLQLQKFRFVAMIDIDNFHDCNNSHGHQFGDLCLKKLAEVCLFVSCDEFKIYRYGGEEFVILSRLQTMETIKKIKDIQNLYYKELGITLSVGVAQNTDYLVPQQVLKKADENMFFVKHNGKNNISLDGTRLVN